MHIEIFQHCIVHHYQQKRGRHCLGDPTVENLIHLSNKLLEKVISDQRNKCIYSHIQRCHRRASEEVICSADNRRLALNAHRVKARQNNIPHKQQSQLHGCSSPLLCV